MQYSDRITTLKEQSALLPDAPGIYQYLDVTGKIIYVGKAKNIRKRVITYFNREHEDEKTIALVKKIHEIRHIVVDSEEDAWLLENSLIKQLQPRYNILLKDDKSYPWIVIKNEPFPRVFKTRKMIKDGSIYYGPYPSGFMLNTLIDLFRQLYLLRTCRLPLSREGITKKKFKRCLEYHIHNCKAPCEGLQSENDYNNYIGEIKNILNGNIKTVINYLKDKMNKLAEEYLFEEAEEVKKRLIALNNYQSKSTVVNISIDKVDVISIINDNKSSYVNFLKVSNGAIIQSYSFEIIKKLNESEKELLSFAIVEIRKQFQSDAKEIIVPFIPEITLKGVLFTVPLTGDKLKLLELSELNVKFYRL